MPLRPRRSNQPRQHRLWSWSSGRPSPIPTWPRAIGGVPSAPVRGCLGLRVPSRLGRTLAVSPLVLVLLVWANVLPLCVRSPSSDLHFSVEHVDHVAKLGVGAVCLDPLAPCDLPALEGLLPALVARCSPFIGVELHQLSRRLCDGLRPTPCHLCDSLSCPAHPRSMLCMPLGGGERFLFFGQWDAEAVDQASDEQVLLLERFDQRVRSRLP